MSVNQFEELKKSEPKVKIQQWANRRNLTLRRQIKGRTISKNGPTAPPLSLKLREWDLAGKRLLLLLSENGESETYPISAIAIIILSKVYRFIHSCRVFFYLFFFSPSRFSLLSSGRSVLPFPFCNTSFKKKSLAAKILPFRFERNAEHEGCWRLRT